MDPSLSRLIVPAVIVGAALVFAWALAAGNKREWSSTTKATVAISVIAIGGLAAAAVFFLSP